MGKSQIRILQRHAIFFSALPLQHSVQQLLSAALKQLATRDHGIVVLQFAVSQTYRRLNAHCVPQFGRVLHGAAHLDGGDTEYVSESVLQIALIKKKNRTIIPKIEVGRGRPTFLFALSPSDRCQVWFR